MIEPSDLVRQSHQEIETARTLIDDSKRIALQFVNTEIDLCRTFPESALASLSAGRRVAKAKQSALAAREAYKAAQKFLRMADAEGEQRRLIEAKLAGLEVLIGKLSPIK
jgi:hypothetical protein